MAKNMAKENITLTYINEDDKAYGLAGMAISLAALDAIDRIADVSLDAEGPMVRFSHEYYFAGSPSISPKATWDNLIHNYYITSAMVLSNIMARSIVRLGREVPEDILSTIKDEMREEGHDTCSLDDDEIDSLYNKTSTYMRRIFNNPRLHPAIDSFARTISVKRTLTGREILDELNALQLI